MTRVKISLILSIFLGAIFLGSIESSAFDYVINDFNFYPVPNTPRPPKGVTFQDPVFHTNITRITDAPTDAPSQYGNYIFPGYPKHDIENADGTKLFLQSFKYPNWHIWNANPPYNKIKDIPSQIVNDIDPDVRWDSTDPNILYSTYSSKFYKYNVVTDEITLLHDFQPDFPSVRVARVFTAEEGDSSADSRYWFFRVRCNDPKHTPDPWWDTAYIVYDKDYYGKDNGKIISTLKEGSPLFIQGLNFTDISFDGNWVWCTEPGVVYPRNLSTRWNVPIKGHADRGISREGRQVIFGGLRRWSADGYTDLGFWTVMFDMETRELTYLSKMAKGTGLYHMSANSVNKPGWGLVSVYGPEYPDVPTTWDEASSYLVELTTRKDPPPRVWRLHHTHNVYQKYGSEPFAKINKKGTKVWFGSTWGQLPPAQYDVYQVDLPSTWHKDLMGYIPPSASISANPLSGKPPLTVNFTGSGKGDATVVSYSWNFGDGSTSNQQNVSHTYDTPGSYTATLKVIDDKGAGGSASVTINVLKTDTTPPAPPKGLKIIK